VAQHKLLTGLASLLVVTGIGGAMSDRTSLEWISSAQAQDDSPDDEDALAADGASADEAEAFEEEATDDHSDDAEASEEEEASDDGAEGDAESNTDANAPAVDDSELAGSENEGDPAVDGAQSIASEEPPVAATPPRADAPAGSEAQRRRELREFVSQLAARGQQFADSDSIFKAGFMNSLAAMHLVAFCETKYGKDFSPETFELSNFDTIDALVKTCAPG
jgi:hypothetical protein